MLYGMMYILCKVNCRDVVIVTAALPRGSFEASFRMSWTRLCLGSPLPRSRTKCLGLGSASVRSRSLCLGLVRSTCVSYISGTCNAFSAFKESVLDLNCCKRHTLLLYDLLVLRLYYILFLSYFYFSGFSLHLPCLGLWVAAFASASPCAQQ